MDELELAPVVMVSNDDIIINGISVARVDDLARDDYLNIPALEEKLREQKKETEDLHALANDGTRLQGRREHPGPQGRAVPDHQAGDVQLRRGGYANINFAVLRGSGPGGEKTASLP